MSRQYLVLIFLVMAAAAHARPAPDSQRLPEIDNGSLAETRAAVAPGAGYTGRSAAANAALDDTVMYGGTYWAADSLRWEAIRGGTWTFDTGVGSAFGPTGPNKPAGYHTLMEGWSGVDQGVNESPYFRRSATCAIAGTYSFWVGRTAEEINPLCWAAGQGYGNNWYTEIHKSFSYPGTGNVILSYLFRCDSEDGFDVTDVMVDTSGTGAARDIELISHTGVSSGLATLTLSPGTSLPRSARPIVVKFIFSSDGSYSDEDGMYPTACGAFAVDNISLTGAIAGF